MLAALRGWSSTQKHVVAASFLGWTLDALDFFLLVFVINDIAAEFAVNIPAITVAVTLTLAFRPVGAFLFGRLADHYGRRPVLMANIAVYSSLSFATAFVPSLPIFLLVRAAFGIGMGGIWGIGSSLAMETFGRNPEVSCLGCYNPDIRPDICWHLSSSASCIRLSVGAACSWSELFRHFF